MYTKWINSNTITENKKNTTNFDEDEIINVLIQLIKTATTIKQIKNSLPEMSFNLIFIALLIKEVLLLFTAYRELDFSFIFDLLLILSVVIEFDSFVLYFFKKLFFDFSCLYI